MGTNEGLIQKVNRYIPDLAPQYEGEKPISKIQKMLYNDWEHRIICVPSGRRSRKTLIFMYKDLIQALSKRGNYCLAAPVWKQAKKIFWNRLKDITRLFWARKPLETEMQVFLINGSTIFCTGLENADRIEGAPVNGFHITEVDSCKEEMWTAHLLPMSLDTDAFFYLDGVPDGGLGWFYDVCIQAGDGALPDRDESIQGAFHASVQNPHMAYYHWKSSDVHPKWKLDQIASQYIFSEEMFEQEFDGVFLSLKGAAYKNFSQLNIQNFEYNPNYLVHIGMDFNRTPMTATFSHIVVDGKIEKIFVFDEAQIDDCTTAEMLNHIILDKKFNPQMCRVYPDSTGKAEKSNASKSDIEQIRAAGFEVYAKSTNPRIKDRIANVNRLLCDRQGVRRVFISDRCKFLKNDFNKVKCDQYGKEEAEQKKGRLSHISSAFGYMCYYLFPMYRGGVELA